MLRQGQKAIHEYFIRSWIAQNDTNQQFVDFYADYQHDYQSLVLNEPIGNAAFSKSANNNKLIFKLCCYNVLKKVRTYVTSNW